MDWECMAVSNIISYGSWLPHILPYLHFSKSLNSRTSLLSPFSFRFFLTQPYIHLSEWLFVFDGMPLLIGLIKIGTFNHFVALYVVTYVNIKYARIVRVRMGSFRVSLSGFICLIMIPPATVCSYGCIGAKAVIFLLRAKKEKFVRPHRQWHLQLALIVRGTRGFRVEIVARRRGSPPKEHCNMKVRFLASPYTITQRQQIGAKQISRGVPN